MIVHAIIVTRSPYVVTRSRHVVTTSRHIAKASRLIATTSRHVGTTSRHVVTTISRYFITASLIIATISRHSSQQVDSTVFTSSAIYEFKVQDDNGSHLNICPNSHEKLTKGEIRSSSSRFEHCSESLI